MQLYIDISEKDFLPQKRSMLAKFFIMTPVVCFRVIMKILTFRKSYLNCDTK